MDEGRAKLLKTGIMAHLGEIEKKAKDLTSGGWSAQIALFNEVDEKVAFINLGTITDEDFLGVSVIKHLE
jgi:hypothetical protein